MLSEQWGDEPSAYLGITVPNFPNLFCMYGPGTNLAHGGSLIFHSECQIRYITGCIKALVEGGHQSMEPRPEVHDDYYERTQRELEGLVWSHPSIRALVVQEQAGTDPRAEPVAPRRLLDVDARTRPRRLRHSLSSCE